MVESEYARPPTFNMKTHIQICTEIYQSGGYYSNIQASSMYYFVVNKSKKLTCVHIYNHYFLFLQFEKSVYYIMSTLTCYVIAKSDGGERDKGVVDGLLVAPALRERENHPRQQDEQCQSGRQILHHLQQHLASALRRLLVSVVRPGMHIKCDKIELIVFWRT